MGNITSPSPGPPASRTRPRGSSSPQRNGFLTEILRGENEKAKAAALLPDRGIGVLEWASLCFHQHSRIVRWFFESARRRGRASPTPTPAAIGGSGRIKRLSLSCTFWQTMRLKIIIVFVKGGLTYHEEVCVQSA